MMNRLNEIRDYMEKYIAENVAISIAEEQKYLSEQVNQAKDRLIIRISQALETSAERMDKVVICYLLSSIAIGKYEFCIIPFEEKPFISKPENDIYMDYSELFRLTILSEADLEKEMRKKFIRILPYEIEEIRREFLYRYSERTGELLSSILDSTAGGIKVFFGAYMGEIREIGRIAI